ncbi:uncharacterized protein LOC136081371 [Hydra vulgaris]|uniref:Uncharacterized protein LOC136081371 n=1 Tax=Hydra vulgaris TaxID=6087 RepID=A0ABM4BZX1_HYDVU
MIPLARKANKRGGGVLFYITENLRFFIRLEMSISDDNKEILTIELLTNSSKNILISCCYRPPSGYIESFYAFLCNDILKNSFKEKKLNYIIGDVNLNCFEYHVNNNMKKFYDDLFEYGAIPLINKPTRITSTSATLIDNIITTDFFNETLKKVIIKRFFADANCESFKDRLSLINWNHINSSFEANEVYDTFFLTFYEIFDVNFPKREFIITNKSLKSPWVNKDLRKSSKIKRKLYYYDLLEKYKHNSKCTWQVISQITGNSKLKLCSVSNTIKVDGVFLYEPKQIARELNKYFVSVGPNLANNIPNMINPINDYVFPLISSLDKFEVSFSKFESAFKMLKINKAVGPDDINCNIVIDSHDTIKHILLKVFKYSINQGIFPDQLKIAKITPIFKGGEPSNVSNYRPISILSVFSKILERIFFNRISNHLAGNNILYISQYGFKRNNSTEHAIIHLTRSITDSFEKSEFT